MSELSNRAYPILYPILLYSSIWKVFPEIAFYMGHKTELPKGRKSLYLLFYQHLKTKQSFQAALKSF